MSEAKEVNKVRAAVRAKEMAFVSQTVQAGAQLRANAAAGQGQSQEERQAVQQAATQRVGAQKEQAEGQGQGA